MHGKVRNATSKPELIPEKKPIQNSISAKRGKILKNLSFTHGWHFQVELFGRNSQATLGGAQPVFRINFRSKKLNWLVLAVTGRIVEITHNPLVSDQIGIWEHVGQHATPCVKAWNILAKNFSAKFDFSQKKEKFRKSARLRKIAF
jgi:hypothetical protein